MVHETTLRNDLMAMTLEELSPGVLKAIGKSVIQGAIGRDVQGWASFLDENAPWMEWYTEDLQEELKKHGEILKSKLPEA